MHREEKVKYVEFIIFFAMAAFLVTLGGITEEPFLIIFGAGMAFFSLDAFATIIMNSRNRIKNSKIKSKRRDITKGQDD